MNLKIIKAFSLQLVFSFIFSACSPIWGSTSLLATISNSSILPTQTNLPGVTNTAAVTATWAYATKELTASPTITTESFSQNTEVPTGGAGIERMLYYSQPGDSLQTIAMHFSVDPSEIQSDLALPLTGLVDPGTIMTIPDRVDGDKTAPIQIMPDSEVIFSASAIDFDMNGFVQNLGGYINKYQEYTGSTGNTPGVEEIKRIALENSVNPRLLLALLEYQSGWITGQPRNLSNMDYPMGYVDLNNSGLFRQMVLAVEDLGVGYYGWRSGQLTQLTFPDRSKLRISPELNAGTVAILYFFAKHYNRAEWQAIVSPGAGFSKLFKDMFGDPWLRAQNVEPLFPPGLTQPTLSLPFYPGETWSLTSGPHPVWEKVGALAALDFAPGADQKGCYESESWVLAAAPGQVVRSWNGVVVLDLDNDGHEQTGWDLLYLHIATKDRVPVGTWLNKDDRIGHPSCEGGVSTGTHLHFARKYNGEWVLADGPMPFILSGWVAHNGPQPYEGTLTKGGYVVVAKPNGSAITKIVRVPGE